MMRLHQLDASGIDSLYTALLTGYRTTNNQTVRLTLASVLSDLDIRESAPDLFELSQTGGDSGQRIAEPALARWQFEPIRSLWL